MPPRASCMPPGTVAWTAAAQAGWRTAACATPSSRRASAAAGACPASRPSSSSPTRPASPANTAASTSTASEVSRLPAGAEADLRGRGGPESCPSPEQLLSDLRHSPEGGLGDARLVTSSPGQALWRGRVAPRSARLSASPRLPRWSVPSLSLPVSELSLPHRSAKYVFISSQLVSRAEMADILSVQQMICSRYPNASKSPQRDFQNLQLEGVRSLTTKY